MILPEICPGVPFRILSKMSSDSSLRVVSGISVGIHSMTHPGNPCRILPGVPSVDFPGVLCGILP